MSRARVVAGLAVLVFAVVVVVHLTALVTGSRGPADATMALLMPPLAVYLATTLALPHRRAENRTVVALLVALVFCWFGDLAGDILVKLLAFLVGHVAYAVAWWPWRRFSLAGRRRTRWPAIAGYGAVAAVMVAVLAGHAGWMIGPIAVYAIALSTMAVLSSGAGARAALGGAVFVVSDSLLAWDVFVAPLPAGDLLVMTTYLAAQWLVVSGSRTRLLSRGTAGI